MLRLAVGPVKTPLGIRLPTHGVMPGCRALYAALAPALIVGEAEALLSEPACEHLGQARSAAVDDAGSRERSIMHSGARLDRRRRRGAWQRRWPERLLIRSALCRVVSGNFDCDSDSHYTWGMTITFNGKPFNPNDFKNALMRSAFEATARALRDRVSAIRHQETGEFPTVVVHGETLETMRLVIEGSDELLNLVRQRLSPEDAARVTLQQPNTSTAPRAFLSYAFEDRDLAKRIAEALQSNGIETWWAEWEIRAGDSLRQKIDGGLSGCTHFIVLLTPASVGKPWVNQEMDAGLVRKLNAEAKFIALRSNLPASGLPPLLAGMLSPSLDDFDADIRQLISDIHGLTRKPPLGTAPVKPLAVPTGYSSAATTVAKLFVETSRTALFADPQLTVEAVSEQTGLSEEDVRDALHELQSFFMDHPYAALPKDELFIAFDEHFMGWNPADDALKLAADLLNDADFPRKTPEVAERYGWSARRMNPALSFLVNREILADLRAMGTAPWAVIPIKPRNDALRRFVKSRT